MFLETRAWKEKRPPGKKGQLELIAPSKDGPHLRKGYTFIRRDADGTKPITIGISTESPDRHGDVVSLSGWELANFGKNPIVLWAHSSWEPPVARSERLWIEDGMLLSQPAFTPRDMYAFGATIGDMVRAGFLNAASVGFDPLEYKYNEERPGDWGMPGVDFLRQELLEYSIVPIPANAEALVQSKSLGVEIAPYREWLEKAMEGCFGKGFWVSRDTLEKTWKHTRPSKAVSVAKDDASVETKVDALTGMVSSLHDKVDGLHSKTDAIHEAVGAHCDCDCEECDGYECDGCECEDCTAEGDGRKAAPARVTRAPPVDATEFKSALQESVQSFLSELKTAHSGRVD